MFWFFIVEKNEDWLTNSSFQVAANVQRSEVDAEFIDSDDDELTTTQQQPIKQKKHSKKKKKKEHKHHKEKRPKLETINKSTEPKLEFTGKENYYVDKKPCNSYHSMETLKRDDSARYRVHFHYVGTLTTQQWRILHRRRSKDKSKRYFTKYKTEKVKTSTPDGDADGIGADDDNETTSKNYRLNEDEFTAKTKVLNKNLLSSPNDIDLWLEYIRFQEHFYMKMTKIQLAERKMEILNKSLRDNPSNERLYREYIDILEQTYPSFEVSKFLEALIQKGMTLNLVCMRFIFGDDFA